MEKLLITGNGPLHGEVEIAGAKNAALPVIAASLPTRDPLAAQQCGSCARHRHRAQADGIPGLRGAHIPMNAPSVTATENLLMATALADGTTVIDNAAQVFCAYL